MCGGDVLGLDERAALASCGVVVACEVEGRVKCRTSRDEGWCDLAIAQKAARLVVQARACRDEYRRMMARWWVVRQVEKTLGRK